MKKATPSPRYRVLFARKLQELEEARRVRASFNYDHPLYDELGEKLQAAIKATGSRAKIKKKNPKPNTIRWNTEKALKLLGEEIYNEIMNPIRDRAAREVKRSERAIDSVERTLKKVAPLVPLSSDDKLPPLEIQSVWSSTYRSQPASVSYAKARAEIQAEHLEALLAPVKFTIDREGFGRDTVIFRIKAHVGEDSLAFDVIKRLPPPPLVEFVRKCWGKGVNPRVYYPGLDTGFESEHGLDYFGGQKS